MPFYFLTARAHPSEIQIFEDYLSLALPIITSRKVYHYSIEKDNTADRHLHALLEDNAKDVNAFKRKLNTKTLKSFYNSLKPNLTDPEQLTFVKIVKSDEVPCTVGYIFKETNSRIGSSELSDEKYITDCVKQYWTIERVKARAEDIKDVTLITPKNFFPKVYDFMKKNPEYGPDNCGDLLYAMTKSRCSFMNISKVQLSKGFRELRIMEDKEQFTEDGMGKTYNLDKEKSMLDLYENEDEEKQEAINDVRALLLSINPQTGEVHNNAMFTLRSLQKKYSLLIA